MKMKKLLVIYLLFALVVTSVFINAEAFASTNRTTFELKDTRNYEKFLPNSLGISIPNVNLFVVRDERIIDADEVVEAVEFGKTKSEAKKMTRYELTSFIDSQKLSDSSIEAISETNPEIPKELLTEWTYDQYNQYVYEKNRKQFMPSSEILKSINERNIALDDFIYLRKFFSSDEMILAQSDESLISILKKWYLFKLDFANATSNEACYDVKVEKGTNNEEENSIKYNSSLYVTVSSFQNYQHTNDLFLKKVKTHLSNYRTYQENLALKAFNAIYARPSSNTSATFTNLYGTYSQSQGGAHEGLDMIYGSTPNVHTITGGTATIIYPSSGAVKIHNSTYGDAIYAHMTNCHSGSVSAGDVIGKQGHQGNATGNHVHLEISSQMNSEHDDDLGSGSPYLYMHKKLGHNYPAWKKLDSTYHKRQCKFPECAKVQKQQHYASTPGQNAKCLACGYVGYIGNGSRTISCETDKSKYNSIILSAE